MRVRVYVCSLIQLDDAIFLVMFYISFCCNLSQLYTRSDLIENGIGVRELSLA